jgi:hypothetical protein
LCLATPAALDAPLVNYLDFELEIASGPDGAYVTRVLRSPAGEASGSMTFPLDTLALQNRLQALQLALLKSGRGRRRVELPEAQLVRQFGTELWNALFVGDIVSRFDVSRSEARQQDMGLRVKLRISAPELAALPWEFLFDSRRGSFLALSATTPLVRYTPLAQPIEPLAIVPPLRVLGLIADPVDLDSLDVGREKERLEQALGRLREHGLVELNWVPNGTWRDLQDALRHGPWHIFHFIGHGGFDEARREGLIALVDENHRAHRMTATELGLLLGDHEPLRLAVLNSCDSAKAEDTDVFSSTAASLVRQGTPAVVAMQYEITDLAAIEFSRSFYEAIADGVPVDSAVSEARKGIAVSISGTLEWGTPVLHTRAPDGVLFTIAPEHAASTVIDRSEAPAVVPLVGHNHGAPDAVPAASTTAVTGRGHMSLTSVLTPWRILPIGLAALVVAVVIVWASAFGQGQSSQTPSIALSAARAAVGEPIRVQGGGFAPGETIQVYIGGIWVSTETANENGAFLTTETIPAGLSASAEVKAAGASSHRESKQSIEVVPAAAPSGASVGPGVFGSPYASSGELASGGPGPSLMPSAAASAKPPPTVRPTTAPTATPRPPATPTPTPPPSHVVKVNRSATLVAGDELNVDSGYVTTSGGGDIWFQVPNPGETYLIPELGGRAAIFGIAAPSYTSCKNASVGTSPISIGPGNVGTYLCAHTGQGLVARLLVEDLSDTIQLRVVRWS